MSLYREYRLPIEFERGSMENPIFIIGLPRSGSTLWLNVLAQNPGIYRIGEMHFLTPWRRDFRYVLKKQAGDLTDEKNVERLVELLFSRKLIPGLTGPFWLYDIERVDDPTLREIVKKRIMESDKSLESFFKILLEEITKFKGYERFCLKFPVFANHLPKLLKWYPESRIIHITRDPRAVAMSRTNDPGGTRHKIKKYPQLKFFIKKTMVFLTIVQYIWTSKLHQKFKTIKNYELFRYEDLVKDPEKTVKKLCKFAQIEFVPEMLEPKKGQASSITGEKKKGFDKKASSRWKEIISPFDKTIISLFTKKSMRRFGY